MHARLCAYEGRTCVPYYDPGGRWTPQSAMVGIFSDDM